jgi:hypothetical protein
MFDSRRYRNLNDWFDWIGFNRLKINVLVLLMFESLKSPWPQPERVFIFKPNFFWEKVILSDLGFLGLGRNVWAFGWVALVSLATVVAVPAIQATMQMKSVIYNPFDGEPFDETLIVDVGLRPMLSQKISLNERLGSTGIKPPWDFYIVGRVCFLCLQLSTVQQQCTSHPLVPGGERIWDFNCPQSRNFLYEKEIGVFLR